MSRKILNDLLSGYSHFCVGSLPYTGAEEASRFLLERSWIVPFWPELPARSPAEAMIARARSALERSWRGFTPDDSAGLFAVRDDILKAHTKPAVFKCQLCGLLTLYEFGETGEETFSAALSHYTQSVMRQIDWCSKFLAGLNCPIIFQFDEPGFIQWSAITLQDRHELLTAYSYLYVSISERGHFMGIHSCSGFFPEFLQFPMDLFSFSAKPGELFNLEEEDREIWRSVLARGVVPVPGIWSAKIEGNPDAELAAGMKYFNSLQSAFRSISAGKIDKLLVSADCGHAGSTEGWIEKLYQQG